MKKNKILGALTPLILANNPVFAADNNINFESTAQIENVCLIEADDVNFGQVYAPLTQQGTKSEMRVLCSKGTSFTVDLNYGGNFVDPNGSTSSGNYTVSTTFKYKDSNEATLGYGNYGYRVYKNGEPISIGAPIPPSNPSYDYLADNLGDIACQGKDINQNKIYLRTQEIVNLLYPGSQAESWIDDIKGICNAGTSGTINMNNFNAAVGGVNDKGAMMGAMKGNVLAYQITIPGDINKPWIANVNSYKAIASGEFDKIEVNARIMPASSSSLYPAQDSYFDTVTVVINY